MSRDFGLKRQVQFELTYSPTLVRLAAFAFVRRGIGNLAILGPVFLVVGAALSFSRPYGWLGGMWCGVAGVLLALIVGVYFAHYRHGMAKLRRMKVPHALISLTEEEFSAKADSGSWSVPWRTFRALWQFPDFWLLIIGTNQYITLPAAQLPEDARTFILTFVTNVRHFT